MKSLSNMYNIRSTFWTLLAKLLLCLVLPIMGVPWCLKYTAPVFVAGYRELEAPCDGEWSQQGINRLSRPDMEIVKSVTPVRFPNFSILDYLTRKKKNYM